MIRPERHGSRRRSEVADPGVRRDLPGAGRAQAGQDPDRLQQLVGARAAGEPDRDQHGRGELPQVDIDTSSMPSWPWWRSNRSRRSAHKLWQLGLLELWLQAHDIG